MAAVADSCFEPMHQTALCIDLEAQQGRCQSYPNINMNMLTLNFAKCLSVTGICQQQAVPRITGDQRYVYSSMKMSDSLSKRRGKAQRGPFPVTFVVMTPHLRAGNLNDMFTVLLDRSFLL